MITPGRMIAAYLLLFPSLVAAGPLSLHPRGESLPTSQQGPFVTTADGGVLCIDAVQAHHSEDEGKTWKSSPLFQDPSKFRVSDERALLRTRQGTVIAAWMNLRELNHTKGFKWGGSQEEYDQWILPTYVCRSLDDGKTWEKPILLHKPWCGCIHSLIQLKSGRIVLVGQTVIPEWRHATMTFVSDDEGKTWKMSNILDYGVGRHDHAGSCEATILERVDGSLYMLLRTESGYFYEATSHDEGMTWKEFQKSGVRSVTCCGQMARLADGRAALLWNHPIRANPEDGHSRFELSIAFSSNDGKTWNDRTIIATRYPQAGDKPYENRTSYPYLYERRPGELWITTMQGGIRLKIAATEVLKGEVPIPASIVFLGDSTTAPRPGQVSQVFSQRLERELAAPALSNGKGLGASGVTVVVNSGAGGNTSTDGLHRLKKQLPQLNAKLLVVQFGINDSALDVWKNPPATTPRVPLETYKANLRGIISLAQANGTKVVLMTTNPIRWGDKYKELYGKPPYDVTDETGFEKLYLSRYNDAVRELASEMKIPLVDIHQAFLLHAQQLAIRVDSLLLDGVHPNDDGHAVTAAALLPVIHSELNRNQ